MTEQQRQIASYVARNPVLRPYLRQAGSIQPPRAWLMATRQQLPPLEQFRRELLEDAEFQALKLGNWLRTTDGKLIEEAVSMMIPPAYGPAYELAVRGLTLAAEDQAKAGRQTAGIVAIGSLVIAGAIAIGASGDASAV